jgi:hypothetical protein
MNDTSTIWAGLSWAEAVGLVVIGLIVLAVGWSGYQKWSGRAVSDVKGLRLGHHPDRTPPEG